MERKNMIWGWLLIIIGGLFLLDYFAVIDFSVRALLRLWPVLFIIWGISILPIKRSFKHISIIVVVLGSLVLSPALPKKQYCISRIINTNDNKFEDDAKVKHFVINYPANDSVFKKATLNLNMNAGVFTIDRSSEQYWLDFEANSNVASYYGQMTTNGDEATFIIDNKEASETSHNLFIGTKSTNKANLRLHKKLLWDIELDAGAIELNADLRQIHLNKVDINSGASSINIQLGNLQKYSELHLTSGASSVEIEIPATAYCELSSDAMLSNFDADGFEKVKGTYVTTDVEKNEEVQTIYIELNSAVSSVEIHRK